MAEQQQRGEQLATIVARLDQLVALVQGRLADRLDQLAAALARVQTQLTELEERLAQLRADLVDEAAEADDGADSTVEPEAP